MLATNNAYQSFTENYELIADAFYDMDLVPLSSISNESSRCRLCVMRSTSKKYACATVYLDRFERSFISANYRCIEDDYERVTIPFGRARKYFRQFQKEIKSGVSVEINTKNLIDYHLILIESINFEGQYSLNLLLQDSIINLPGVFKNFDSFTQNQLKWTNLIADESNFYYTPARCNL